MIGAEEDATCWKRAFEFMMESVREERQNNSNYAPDLMQLDDATDYEYDILGWPEYTGSDIKFRKAAVLKPLGREEEAVSFCEKWMVKEPENIVAAAAGVYAYIDVKCYEKAESYFTSFQNQHGKYSLKFVKTSKDTDLAGLQKSMETYWSNNELSAREGDKAYIVVDLDCSEQKAKSIEDLSKKSKHVKFIVSNPCVEVWFLLHYNYSTHQFLDGKAVLRPMLSNALANAERLTKYYAELGNKWVSAACNPRKDVPELIRELGVE